MISSIRKPRRGRSLRRRARKGAAVVEFAVVAPLIIMLLVGILELGRVMMIQQSLTMAAREGARAAIIDGTTNEDVHDIVDAYLRGSGCSNAGVDVDGNGAAVHGQPIRVTVSVQYEDVSWFPAPKYLLGKTLSSTATMRRESPN